MEYIYAALLLHRLGKEVTEKNLKSTVAATGVEVDESKVKSLIASLKGVDIDKELENASALQISGPASDEKASKEEKKEKPKEEKKESAAEGLSALFG